MSRVSDERAARLLRETDAGEGWDAPNVERALGTLHRNIRRRRVVRASLAISSLAAAALLFALGPMQGDRAAHRPASSPSPRVNALATLPLRLNDGSVITTASHARVILREVSASRVRVQLDEGVARFDVTRKPEREFIVRAGAIRVLVIGTRFEVERLGPRTRVRVDRGHVRVLWNDSTPQRRDLLAGSEGTFPDGPSTELSPAPPVAPGAVAEPERPSRSRDHAARVAIGGDSRSKAYFGEAFDLIVQGGSASVHDDVDDLLLAADAARLSGRPAQALPYLDRVVDRHASDGRASMAAFTRGRILLGLGRARNAAASFDRALALGAQGSLHENALARSIEAHGRAGDSAAAAHARANVSRALSPRSLADARARLRGIDE